MALVGDALTSILARPAATCFEGVAETDIGGGRDVGARRAARFICGKSTVWHCGSMNGSHEGRDAPGHFIFRKTSALAPTQPPQPTADRKRAIPSSTRDAPTRNSRYKPWPCGLSARSNVPNGSTSLRSIHGTDQISRVSYAQRVPYIDAFLSTRTHGPHRYPSMLSQSIRTQGRWLGAAIPSIGTRRRGRAATSHTPGSLHKAGLYADRGSAPASP